MVVVRVVNEQRMTMLVRGQKVSTNERGGCLKVESTVPLLAKVMTVLVVRGEEVGRANQ